MNNEIFPNRDKLILHPETTRSLIDIPNDVNLTSKSMAENLVATFLPEIEGSDKVKDFGARLKESLRKHGTSIIPFKDAFSSKGDKKRIKENIVTFVIGERKGKFLPIRYVMTSTSNPIVTIVEMPKTVKKDLTYKEHMEIALNLFSWHMCHVAICVGETDWIMYSFNGLSDFYPIETNFDNTILNNVIPKITSRVAPPKIDEFDSIVVDKDFIDTPGLKPYVMDLVNAGEPFAKSGLFDVTKNMGEFNYKDKIYERIVSMHLDERRGMSYGFLARFLPLKLSEVMVVGFV
ncbi:MAG: hypothetical protein ABIG55_01690 [Candidatus Omnitrophota bacterium]